MGNKLKLAIIGLLGFSTACSTVKKSEKPAEVQPEPETVESVPAIRVMYGVRQPDRVRMVQPLETEEAQPEVDSIKTSDSEK